MLETMFSGAVRTDETMSRAKGVGGSEEEQTERDVIGFIGIIIGIIHM